MTDHTQPPGAADPTESTTESAIDQLPAAELLKIIKDLRKENAAHRKAKKEAQTAASAAEEKALAEQQEWKKLAEKYKAELDALKPTADRFEQMQETFKAALTKRLETIPEQYRSLVPEYDDPVKTMSWLDANSQLFATRIAPKLDAGAQGDASKSAPKLTPEQEQYARAAGMSNDEYAKYLGQRNAPVTRNIPEKVLGGGQA